jgi:hypothetical protein
MLPTFISAGRFIYYISYLAYENQETIFAVYSLYDTSKFAFYVSEQVGIVGAIKNILTYKTPPTLLEITSIEKSELGDFEVIENLL